MLKFKTTLAYNREKIVDTCSLEITSNGYQEAIILNKEEVKQLLDLMQEAYSLMGKKLSEVPSSFVVDQPVEEPKETE